MKVKSKLSCLLLLMFSITSIFPVFTKAAKADENFNYGEALQKSIFFYECQRSGNLPQTKRENWRGDSALSDGSDVGLDLTGGWYDAGDNVKFNLPMSYTATMLAWSVYEDKDAYVKSGQLSYMMDAIKWANDYFIKCHPNKDIYYCQVGNGDLDHGWWGAPEVMQMKRPVYHVSKDKPGSTVTAEAAASLASCALLYKDSNESYSKLCLKHASELYELAVEMNGNSGYTEANGFYPQGKCFYDELSWAATWLYLATDNKDYLSDAEKYVDKWDRKSQSDIISYDWTQCWDDVHYGAQLLLAKITGKKIYKDSVERNLDYWTTGYNGERVKYTPKGLAWRNEWGPLRYATTEAFLAGVYAEWDGCPESKRDTYKKFLKSQVDYALGSSGQGYVVGTGINPPKNPHHRAAQSSWCDDKHTAGFERHVIYGALVGGPGVNDDYKDDVEDFKKNEVACDYNAGYTGAVVKLYKEYGGDPIKDFKDIETPSNDEYYVEAAVNASGTNFIEIKAVINNKTGWPARVSDKLSFKYFVDISELVNQGLSTSDVVINTNYNQGATVSKLIPWNKEKNIYYVNVDFSGTKIYPGGQQYYKKEVQFRLTAQDKNNNNVKMDTSNDYSFEGIGTTPGGQVIKSNNIPVYDDGKLVYGIEPSKDSVLGDINNDGKVTLLDYVIMQKTVNGIKTGFDESRMDLNNDGNVDIKDLFKLRQILLS